MKVKRIIQKDRSALSTIAVIAIVIVLVVAAGVVYIAVSGGNEDDAVEEAAPGTMMKYEMYEKATESAKETLSGTREINYLGQSADSYFLSVTETNGSISNFAYMMDTKSGPDDMEMIGTEEIETKYGLMTLQVWTYTKDGNQVKSYVDAETGLGYKHEVKLATGGFVIQKLVDYNIELQKSYKESKSIGKTYKYVYEATGVTLTAEIKTVADCMDGQFGVEYDFNSFGGKEIYFLSDNIQGLPTDANNTGEKLTLETKKFGKVEIEVWEMFDGALLFGYDPKSHIIYQFALISYDPVSEENYYVTFDLDKKA